MWLHPLHRDLSAISNLRKSARICGSVSPPSSLAWRSWTSASSVESRRQRYRVYPLEESPRRSVAGGRETSPPKHMECCACVAQARTATYSNLSRFFDPDPPKPMENRKSALPVVRFARKKRDTPCIGRGPFFLNRIPAPARLRLLRITHHVLRSPSPMSHFVTDCHTLFRGSRFWFILHPWHAPRVPVSTCLPLSPSRSPALVPGFRNPQSALRYWRMLHFATPVLHPTRQPELL